MSIKKTHLLSGKKKHKKPGAKPRVQELGKTEAEIKQDIMILAAVQWPEDDIAKVFGMTHAELKAKYQHELEIGPLVERAKIIKAMKRKAHTGDVPACRFLASLGEENFVKRQAVRARPEPEKKLVQKVKKVAEPKLGKKEQDLVAAKAGHKGTAWEDHLKH